MPENNEQYFFDDAVGGVEGGNSGDASNYDSNFSDWKVSNGNYNYVGGDAGNMGWFTPNQQDTFGSNGYQVGSDNTQYWNNSQGQPIGFQLAGGEFTPYQGTQQNSDWANLGQSALGGLSKLFGGFGGSGGGTNTFLKGLAGLLAAQQEKKSNQQMSQHIPQTVNSVRQFAAPYDVSSTGAGMMTPGATTMRDAAQQQAALANQRLQSFRSNPNSDAGYKATNDQIEQVLNRQAAMHGNRNNFNATAPAMLAAKAAAQLKYDQNYQQDLNNWDVRSGANISPVQAGGLEALMRGQQYGAQGNSPYYDALGKILNTNSYENNPQIQELLQAIKGR